MWNMLQERKALTASVSHDLRTPITVINGYLDYLDKASRKQIITEEALHSTLKQMKGAVQRLERYVECVKDIQKIEDIEIKEAHFNLKEYIISAQKRQVFLHMFCKFFAAAFQKIFLRLQILQSSSVPPSLARSGPCYLQDTGQCFKKQRLFHVPNIKARENRPPYGSPFLWLCPFVLLQPFHSVLIYASRRSVSRMIFRMGSTAAGVTDSSSIPIFRKVFVSVVSAPSSPQIPTQQPPLWPFSITI